MALVCEQAWRREGRPWASQMSSVASIGLSQAWPLWGAWPDAPYKINNELHSFAICRTGPPTSSCWIPTRILKGGWLCPLWRWANSSADTQKNNRFIWKASYSSPASANPPNYFLTRVLSSTTSDLIWWFMFPKAYLNVYKTDWF